MILDRIAASAKKRVAAAREKLPLGELSERAAALPGGGFSFEQALKGPELSFICEIKKASPSKGLIAEDFSYMDIAGEYERAGAAAISVLTEPEYFMGKDEYLTEIGRNVRIPILRKDFTVDEYQLYEAKVMGAGAVLLICALLDTDTIRRYISICDSLGLSALVEAHTAGELRSAMGAGARIIGVNNRDLRTFEVDLGRCTELRNLTPDNVIFVAESGIRTREDVQRLEAAGVHGVLIGETLMRSPDRCAALNRLRGEPCV